MLNGYLTASCSLLYGSRKADVYQNTTSIGTFSTRLERLQNKCTEWVAGNLAKRRFNSQVAKELKEYYANRKIFCLQELKTRQD